MKMIEPYPYNRYQSAAEIARDLKLVREEFGLS
jgi:hypothetical protein